MGKWKSVIYVVSALVLSVVLGISSGTVLSARAADSNPTIGVLVSFELEGKSYVTDNPYNEDVPGGINYASIAASKEDLTGIRTIDLLTRYMDSPENQVGNFINGKTQIDWLEIVFRRINGELPEEKAYAELKSLYASDPMTQSSFDSWVSDLKEVYVGMTKDSNFDFYVDLTKTKAEAEKIVKPKNLNGDKYLIPTFVFYLRPRNFYTHTIKYVVPQGVTAPDDHIETGLIGDKPIEIPSPQIAGYQPNQKSVIVNFAKDDAPITTVYYSKIGTTTPPVMIDHSSLTADDTAVIMTGQTIDAETFNARATDRNGFALPVTLDDSRVNYHVPGTYSVVLKAANDKSLTVKLIVKQSAPNPGVGVKGAAVSGLKTLYLYQTPTFNKKYRLVKYPRTSRTKRPMFVVTDYGYSKSGLLRYHVRDVNHHSKTAGKRGYITAKSAYVASTYYQKIAKWIKVLNPQGVNGYRNNDLTKKVQHFKRGQRLAVVGLEHHNLTTRFKLSNGQYVTANKKLVMTLYRK